MPDSSPASQEAPSRPPARFTTNAINSRRHPTAAAKRSITPPLRILLPQPPNQRVPLSPLPGRQLVRLNRLPMQLPRPRSPGVRHSPTT